jgi:opacity protein-like surface antigen
MNKQLCVVAILGLLTQLPVALAQEGAASQTQVTIGARVWHSSWLSYLPSVYTGFTPGGAPGLVDSIDAVEGSTKTDVLPAIGVRYKDYLLSGSYARYTGDFEALHSSVISPGGQNIVTSRTDHISRKESDLAVGYYLTPNIALSLGYKYATEERATRFGIIGTSSPFLTNTVRGILVGAGASFPIQGGLRFYGNFGYGPARVKTEFADPTMARIDSNGRYLISEIGLNYALPFSTALMKGVSAGLGYRSQSFRTRGVGPAYRDRRDFRDVKDGVVLSLNISI